MDPTSHSRRSTPASRTDDASARTHCSVDRSCPSTRTSASCHSTSRLYRLHFLARPLGMMQMCCAMLAAWDDLSPDVPDEEVRANIAVAAAAMAEGGGESA